RAHATSSRYRFASVTLSVKPALRLCRVPGTQIVPAEVAVVPPTRSDFSQRITSRPSRELTRAAVMPAAPAPTTSASTSTVAVPRDVPGVEIGISPPDSVTAHAGIGKQHFNLAGAQKAPIKGQIC